MHALLAVALLWVAPSTDRISYDHPERYVALVPSLGNPESIRKTAAEIPGKSDEQKLREIDRWIRAHLKSDDHSPNVWRDFDGRLKEGVLSSCADRAVLFGTLARALAIPTVWVKTMDADWIVEFKRDPKHFNGVWRGHVFLEVFVDKKWQLLDASEMRLYADYDPRARLLPTNRWAYDKGEDPAALTLSLHGDEWREQTRAHFTNFDLRQLPVLGGRPLIRNLHVVADTPIHKWVQARGEQRGLRTVASFNTQFDWRLRDAAGHWLILTALGTRFPLASEYRDRYSPLSSLQLEQALAKQPSGRADRKLADGTRVVLVYGRDEAALRAEIERLIFDEE